MKYSVTGRKFTGQLCAPVENLTEVQDYDDKQTAMYYADALAKLGYRVWLYEQRERSPMDQPAWMQVAEWRDGKRLS